MTFPCIKCKIHKCTNSNTQIQSALKDLKCAIFLKSMGFKDINYYIPVYLMWNKQIHKYKMLKRPNICYIFYKHGMQGYQIWYSRESNENTQIHKYKVLKRHNTCYIFEKHEIQGYQLWHSCVTNVNCTNTQIRKYTNTKCLKDTTLAIFLKSMGFKGIICDIPVYQMWNTQIHKYKVLKRHNICYIY